MTAGMRRKIILDTDPAVGIPGTDADDPLALMLALRHPALDLIGVTTVFGNCPPDLGARSAAAVLKAAGREDVPVAQGMGTTLHGDIHPVLQEAYRGARGRPGRILLPDGPTVGRGSHAIDLLIELVRRHPGEVTIVAIGPQTNLAMALLKELRLRKEIASVVFMGGALGLEPTFGRGNITAVAECNIWFDPWAADVVFRSGLDLTMVSPDVTNPTTGMLMPEAVVRQVDRTASPLAALFADVCATYMDAPMFDWGHGCVLYDPLAVMVAAEPDVGTFEAMALGVETEARHGNGQTIPLRDRLPNVRVMTHVDGTPLVARMVETILA